MRCFKEGRDTEQPVSWVTDCTSHTVRGSESPVITGHAAVARLQVGLLDQIFTLL